MITKLSKKVLHIFFKSLMQNITRFKPYIRTIAEACDIRLNYPSVAIGQNPLEFEDPQEIYMHNVPKSVRFNTRSGKISIGKNTVFGEDVQVLTGKHNFISDITNIDELQSVPNNGRDIYVGSNCYIGGGAIIVGKVCIGDYSVVCAGAVVTKDVPSYSVVAGIPAKKIRDLKLRTTNE